MKSLSLVSLLVLACAGSAHAEVNKNTPVAKLGAAVVTVKFTSDTIIPAGQWFVTFPTTANTKGCSVYASKVDATNDRRIKAGIQKDMKLGYSSNVLGQNGLIVQGVSEIHGIFCAPGGVYDVSNYTVQDVENSAGGTMTFTVTPPVPVDIN